MTDIEFEDGEAPEERERWQILHQLEEWLEGPMILLSFVWLLLVLVELIWGSGGVFEFLGTDLGDLHRGVHAALHTRAA